MLIYDKARELAKILSESPEYAQYQETRAKAMENETTRVLIQQYHQLQIQAQAMTISKGNNSELLEKLQKIGELLQMDPSASAFLLAEFQIKRILGDVYKILAEAVDIDLGMLEE